MPVDLKFKGPKVLLAEGKNDCHVILSLCGYHDIPENFGFFDCGSDKNVLKRMSALIAGSEDMETIGVVLDADNPNLSAKWESLCGRLKKEGYSVPNQPDNHGTILSAHGKPTIGIWLMPDNNVNGMLEDFCYQLAAPEAIDFAENCVDRAKKNKFANFSNNHTAKAIVHTYLAWQNVPGMPLGQAITAKALNPEQELAGHFVTFLKKLF
jgi:hypothetical protein